jgi:hypothetical protein
MATLSIFEPASLKRGEELLVRPPVRKGLFRRSERRVPSPFQFQYMTHRGACGKTRVVPHNCQPKPEPTEMGGIKMRVLWLTYGSPGDVEPMAGEAWVCSPLDFAELLAGVGVSLVPTGVWR